MKPFGIGPLYPTLSLNKKMALALLNQMAQQHVN
jgi:hypothetical protein